MVYAICRLYPVHDSDSILLVRLKHYIDNIELIKSWYEQEHDNWHEIEAVNSRWKVWNECRKLALFSAKQIQQYLSRISSGRLNHLVLLFFQSEFF